MSKLVMQFNEFLSAIEPDGKAVGYASEAHNRVRKHLEQDEKFKDYLEGSFLYGSYKRNTAICEIKDVDIVLLTNFDPSEEENTPQNVLRKVKDAINRHYNDSENQQYQRRSIRVDDPLPEEKDAHLTLDVIPAYASNGDSKPLLVPDRELKQWVPSHPMGHIKNAITLNDKDHGNGMYVPLVKLMKYWWRYQCELRQPDVERPKPKGFWVECLTAENFDQNQKSYADHFISVLENVSEKYSDVTDVPELEDPGLRGGETIKTSMTLDEFQVFMEAVNESLDLAYQAEAEEDEVKSSKLWGVIFGERFPLVKQKSFIEKIFPKGLAIGDFSHKQNTSEVNIIDRGNYSVPVKIRAELYWGKPDDKIANRRNKGFFASASELPIFHWLKYEIVGDIPYNHEIYWQVVNTGAHAHEKRSEGGLRGEIKRGGREKWERSLYTGVHWVECFIVDPSSRRCVGRSGPFYVAFNNPNFPFRQ